VQTGMQTIFPGHFPKASENTALSEYSFSWRIPNWQPKSCKTYRQVHSKNTIASEKKESVMLKIELIGDVSSLCLSVSEHMVSVLCMNHNEASNTKVKRQIRYILKKNSQKLLFLSTAPIQRPEW